MAQDEDSRGLLKTVLGYFARKGPEATPTRQQIFMRTDAYLHDDLDEYSDVQPDQVARTLSALEKSVHTPRIPGNVRVFARVVELTPLRHPALTAYLANTEVHQRPNTSADRTRSCRRFVT
jgi:hypothetical protein